MHTSSEQENRRRKRMGMIILILALTGITALTTWALWPKEDRRSDERSGQAINMQIPDAVLDPTLGDKMSLMEQARKDSLERSQSRSLDPFAAYGTDSGYQPPAAPGAVASPFFQGWDPSQQYSPSTKAVSPDAQVAMVGSRLAALQAEINRTPAPVQQPAASSTGGTADPELRAMLEQLLEARSPVAGTNSPDPELSQLSTMMDKVMDIQHPALARERLERESARNKRRTYSVSTRQQVEKVDFFGTATPGKLPAAPDTTDSLLPSSTKQAATKSNTGLENTSNTTFYEWNNSKRASGEHNSLAAVIHQTQVVVNGATLKMRTTEDAYVAGMLIPTGTFLYGICNLEGERLSIRCPSIRYGANLLPVQLVAFDLDGLAGVKVPGAITRTAIKDNAAQAISSLELMSMDPGIGAQAAAAGASTVKSILSSKAKLIKVTVQAGYPVLLVDEQQNQ